MGIFTIIHVNIRGLRANRDNLIRYLEENSFPEVVTLNETKINQESNIHKILKLNVSNITQAKQGYRNQIVL